MNNEANEFAVSEIARLCSINKDQQLAIKELSLSLKEAGELFWDEEGNKYITLANKHLEGVSGGLKRKGK